MADDIDIEEHDVLENPALKSMFPDISALKQEIKNFETGFQANSNFRIETNIERSNSEDLNSDLRDVVSIDDDDDDVEIIEVQVDHKTDSVDKLLAERQTETHSNKIILGSKPNKALECREDFFEDKVKSYNVSVVLDDMRSYLDSSGRFCNECLILFPSKSDLEIHYKKNHSGVAFESKTFNQEIHDDLKLRFKCTKCNILFKFQSELLKHTKRVHNRTRRHLVHKVKMIFPKLNTNLNKKYKSKDNKCFHCKKLFSTQQSLIEHLYSTLQSNKFKCKDCSQNFTNIEQLNKHTLTHKKCVVVLKDVANCLSEIVPETSDMSKDSKHINAEDQNSPATSNLEKEVKITADCHSPQDLQHYRCYICSCYFTESRSLSAHLATKHNISGVVTELNKEKFDYLCKYCSKYCFSFGSYNRHVRTVHKEFYTKFLLPEPEKSKQNFDLAIHTMSTKSFSNKGNGTVKNIELVPEEHCEEIIAEPLVLKSALFKCSKCDIHFISHKIARNHLEHMEMLINWKCLKCNHIFKKEDESFHEEQHKFSQDFIIHELCPAISTPILFNCSKCSVHFDEDNFLKHNLTCKDETPNSVFCLICDIVIDIKLSKLHRSEHISKNLKHSDFIIVNSDVLVKTEKTKSDILTRKKNQVFKRKHGEKSAIPCKKGNPESGNVGLLDLIFCDTCKCFLARSDDLELHVEGNCQQLEKHVCKICGLILTEKSYTTTHRSVHNKIENVKLKDFQFYDIKSYKKICPPTPEYLKCEHCDVYLISKDAIFCHVCSKTEYLTCHLCNINLTDDAFKLHMAFHNYAINKDNIELNHRLTEMYAQPNRKAHRKSTRHRESIRADHGVDKNIQPNSKKRLPQIHIDNRNLTGQANTKTEPLKKIITIKNTKNNSKPKGTDEKSLTVQTKIKVDSVRKIIRTKYIQNDSKLIKSPTDMKSQMDKDIRESSSRILATETKLVEKECNVNLDGVLYQCQNCHLSMDSYDKVIEHCQGHYCNDENDTETINCKICGISLNIESSVKHEKLHVLNTNKDFFTFLNFDTFYFMSENRIWIEHVFGTLPQKIKDEITRNSIYKHECRIKMEVIQKGPADLTVYKCDRCRSFIDERSLYKHAENSCFKLRKHPCSVCSLPFNSSLSRIAHEHIHERPNLNMESYRIVTFNKEEESFMNKLLYTRSQYYVLYQCRNCSVAIDKSQTKNHKCYQRNLKICPSCGLLLLNEDFDNHILRHKELSNFVEKNIKVILFGEYTENTNDEPNNDMVSAFTGILYDYTFYSCSKCEVCVKSNENLDKHSCYFGANRLKCSRCKLYFLTSKLKQHIKLHETDYDFVRENMRVIMFNSQLDFVKENSPDKCVPPAPLPEDGVVPRNKHETKDDDQNMSHSVCVMSKDDKEKPDDHSMVEEKFTRIYKCSCGLHYLDQCSMITHFKVCDIKTRVAKQRCTKCQLLFTAEVLFTHLIMHHGNKSLVYKFTIINITQNNIIYRCSNCGVHFVKLDDVNDHFNFCDGTTEGKVCIFCNLKFESVSFLSHNCNNVDNINAGVEVIDLNEPLVQKKTGSCDSKQLEIISKKDNHEHIATPTIHKNSAIDVIDSNGCLPVTAIETVTTSGNKQLEIPSKELDKTIINTSCNIQNVEHLLEIRQTTVKQKQISTKESISSGNNTNDKKNHNDDQHFSNENTEDFSIDVIDSRYNTVAQNQHWQQHKYRNKHKPRQPQPWLRNKKPWVRNAEHWRYGGEVRGQDRFRPPPYNENHNGLFYPNCSPMWPRFYNERQ